MPTPERVTGTIDIQPSPDLEQLTAPDVEPRIGAQEAWNAATTSGRPSSKGTTRLLLGYLYEQNPAVIQPDNSAKPIYTHSLVWALWTEHQPEDMANTLTGGVLPPGQSLPPLPLCEFGSSTTFIDATTGKLLGT